MTESSRDLSWLACSKRTPVVWFQLVLPVAVCSFHDLAVRFGLTLYCLIHHVVVLVVVVGKGNIAVMMTPELSLTR